MAEGPKKQKKLGVQEGVSAFRKYNKCKKNSELIKFYKNFLVKLGKKRIKFPFSNISLKYFLLSIFLIFYVYLLL